MKSLTDIQIAVRDSYENGEYQYVESQREADKVGDAYYTPDKRRATCAAKR